MPWLKYIERFHDVIYMAYRLAVLASHPIQYQAPLFRVLSRRVDLKVFFAHRQSDAGQAAAGFDVSFDWDVDLYSSYKYEYLNNIASQPGVDRFSGVDTPDIKVHLIETRFDALLVMGWHLKSYIQGIIAAKKLGLPVLVRGDSQLATSRTVFKRMGKRLIYPLLLRSFDAALFVGKNSRDYYRYYGYPSERLFFSPHCVDNAWFAQRATIESRFELRRRLGIANDEKVLLFAGKLQPLKRPLDLLEAAANLRRNGKNVRVLIAGSGLLERSLNIYAMEQEIPINLLGFQNQTEMPAVYAAADVLVLPSSSETWGLVVNEALACGTPVVLSDACGCAPDLVADGSTGAVYPVGDVNALADGLARLLDRPPLLHNIIAKSQEYSLEHAADGLCDALAFL
jgi:glycosyltransferase involved in cell wall biosynthesis